MEVSLVPRDWQVRAANCGLAYHKRPPTGVTTGERTPLTVRLNNALILRAIGAGSVSDGAARQPSLTLPALIARNAKPPPRAAA
jgi:hypothetical protein